MPVNPVDSRPSAPPQLPPEPKKAANNDVQTARPASSTRAGTAFADRYADRFEPGSPSSRGRAGGPPRLQLLEGGAQPGGAQAGAPQGNVQPLAAAPQPPPNAADPATRQRVEAEITRRLGAGGNARDIADRLARSLGNGDMRRGMEILNTGLRNNRLNVGMAGINGLFGGPRTQPVLDGLQRDMRAATGGNVDTVLDNANGGGHASRGEANPAQLAALTEIGNLGAQLGLRVDVVSHSNGFNAVRAYLANNPNARLGNITLVNPNIPPNLQDTQRAFRDMVRQSGGVRLITSLADEAVPLSGAARNGPVWQQQINAAAAAGVQDITVLRNAAHSVESVGQHLNQNRRPNLDFAWDPQQRRTVPRDLEAWRQAGFTWSAANGFQAIPTRRAAGE